jgi:hypothetical protein
VSNELQIPFVHSSDILDTAQLLQNAAPRDHESAGRQARGFSLLVAARTRGISALRGT